MKEMHTDLTTYEESLAKVLRRGREKDNVNSFPINNASSLSRGIAAARIFGWIRQKKGKASTYVVLSVGELLYCRKGLRNHCITLYQAT